MNPLAFRALRAVSTAVALMAAAAAGAATTTSVSYSPSSKSVQSTTSTFVVTVTAPSNLPSGKTTKVALQVQSLAVPSGVTSAQLLSYLTLSTSSLVFTGPGQSASTTVTINIKSTVTGNYEWVISGTGWPTGVTDAGLKVIDAIAAPAVKTPPITTVQSPASMDTYYVGSATEAFSIPVQVEGTVAAGGSPITAVTATVSGPGLGSKGVAPSLSVAGLGTLSATGTGSLTVKGTGSYSVAATTTNAYGSSTDTIDFTVALTPPLSEPNETVAWLPPLSLNQTLTGGTTVPVAFSVLSTTNGQFVTDKTLYVSIYEILSTGYPTTPVVYPYGTSGYQITGTEYVVNYATGTGTHHYRVEVDATVSYAGSATGTTLETIGTNDFYTK